MVLPAGLRRTMNLQTGSELILAETREGEWRMFTRADALAEARALVRQHVGSGDSLVDELLAERRSEARRKK